MPDPAVTPRRAQWNEAVRKASVDWREAFGYQNGPIMDHRMVEREVRAMLVKVIEGRLLILFAPMMTTIDSIERSALIIGMLASPSNIGPERYAPKADDRPRISTK